VAETTGVLLIDKPVGPSSREVLDGVESRLRIGAIGHAGTLDPLASGLLVALAGKARRLQEFFLDREKTYVARVRFGETSPTLDGEGPVGTTGIPPGAISPDEIRAFLERFQGEVLQVPPVFSAMRVGGRRAHELARKGRPVVLEPRPVRIGSISLLAIEGADWVLEITCGPGVYVRSLARDLGEARGCGAYLAELRRTRSGPLRVEDAINPAVAALAHLRPLSLILAAELRIEVSEGQAKKLALGDVIEQPEGTEGQPRFAWFRGRPCFRLTAPSPGLLRSDLLIDRPGDRDPVRA
jgi:tRNA pseudouridine55 synthase